MIRVSGQWISPQGEIVPAKQKHIMDIIANPKKFGFTDDHVRETFAKHGEDPKVNIEGDAREELIEDALKRGWIRVRGYRNYVSMTVSKLNDNIKATIWRWVANQVKDKKISKLDEVRIVAMDQRADSMHKHTAEDILKFALEEAYDEAVLTSLNERYTPFPVIDIRDCPDLI